MRLVLTSDTHTKVNPAIIPDGDVFIHCGDLCESGTPEDWKNQIEWLSELKHKTKLMIFGNHDFHPHLYPGPALQDMRKIGFTVVGMPGNDRWSTYTLENGKVILGLPYVVSMPRWAFNISKGELSVHLSKFRDIDIVCSHSPIYGILDEIEYPKEHVGIKAYKNFLEAVRPELWFSGHIHESYGHYEYHHEKVDKITNLYNVCMQDYFGEQTNPPVVVDI